MIVYDNRGFWGPFHPRHLAATIIPKIWLPMLGFGIWSYCVFRWQIEYPEYWNYDLDTSMKLLGGFTSFFLIFRTNQSYQRYWRSNRCLKLVQISARELHRQFVCYLMGGCMKQGDPNKQEEAADWDIRATVAKTDATRYCMAFCVAFKLHARLACEGYMLGEICGDTLSQVNFDRARLRGLLTHEEFAVLDSMLKIFPGEIRSVTNCGMEGHWKCSSAPACRAVHVCIFFLRCLIMQCSLASKEWGWMERCLGLADKQVTKLLMAFEEMDQLMTTPMPLPYSHLCKVMLFMFTLAYPLTSVKCTDGLLLNVGVPMVISMAMLGIESISMEIEQPFGEDLNDFNTLRVIAGIEASMWDVMVCRDDPCIDNFLWIEAPPGYTLCTEFVALRAEADTLLRMMPGAKLRDRNHRSGSPGSSHISPHHHAPHAAQPYAFGRELRPNPLTGPGAGDQRQIPMTGVGIGPRRMSYASMDDLLAEHEQKRLAALETSRRSSSHVSLPTSRSSAADSSVPIMQYQYDQQHNGGPRQFRM